MLHAYVRRFNMTSTMQKFLGTKQGLRNLFFLLKMIFLDLDLISNVLKKYYRKSGKKRSHPAQASNLISVVLIGPSTLENSHSPYNISACSRNFLLYIRLSVELSGPIHPCGPHQGAYVVIRFQHPPIGSQLLM